MPHPAPPGAAPPPAARAGAGAVGRRGPPPARAAAAADAGPSAAPPEPSELRELRLRLARPFPNTLLLPGSRLPPLRGSKHFVNLTNGLELAPLLEELEVPYSAVRIRSTCLEQQLFEQLLLEQDANLLLALALGHSCIVWDCGCRNRTNGAPRALWYGIEFLRYALQRFWAAGPGRPGSGGGRGGAGGGWGGGGGGGQPGRRLWPGGAAHLRGCDVGAEFEAACRQLHPSTKRRLRYYARFVPPRVRERGVRLAGAFRRTEHDEDVAFFAGCAERHLGPHAGGGGGAELFAAAHGCGRVASGGAPPSDLAGFALLAGRGVGFFEGGLSHSEYLQLRPLLLQEGAEAAG